MEFAAQRGSVTSRLIIESHYRRLAEVGRLVAGSNSGLSEIYVTNGGQSANGPTTWITI
jgi:hypothetical protein